MLMSVAARENMTEAGLTVRDVCADVDAIRSGAHTRESLLAFCMSGADEDRAQGWADYVGYIVDAAEPLPCTVQS